MKMLRVAIGLTLAAGAAACSGRSSSPILPADASFDGGGHTLGGGAREEPPAEQGATVSGDTTGRGGHTLGSGA
jgi:hypothetical protein